MDEFNYPRLSLKWFSEYCLIEGPGLFKSEIREEKPQNEELEKKPKSKSKSREKKRPKISQNVTPEIPAVEAEPELFVQDICESFSKILAPQAKVKLSLGEYVASMNNEITVDYLGFCNLILKIAFLLKGLEGK